MVLPPAFRQHVMQSTRPSSACLRSDLRPSLHNKHESWTKDDHIAKTVRLNRSLHNTARHSKANEAQAVPLGDFYNDLLSKPLPKKKEAEPSLPTFVRSGDLTKEERAARLFGSIEGSGYERQTSDVPDATWRTINGVPVPPRPAEPDNCCMSGCVQYGKV